LVDRQCVGYPGGAGAADPPARHGRHGKPRKDGKPSESKSDSLRAAMRARLDSAEGKAGYAKRSRTIEPVFGQVKAVQGGLTGTNHQAPPRRQHTTRPILHTATTPAILVATRTVTARQALNKLLR
jgi:Transposase DDE domain